MKPGRVIMMSSVPEKFKPIFWDTSLDSLDIEKHKTYIMPSILKP